MNRERTHERSPAASFFAASESSCHFVSFVEKDSGVVRVVAVTKPARAASYFLRLVGPARTITAAKPGWDALLASVRAK